MQQAVFVLHTDEARRAGLRRARRLVELLGGKIRAADLADLASLDQAVHGAERIGDRHVRIGLMQLIEIDVVGAESAKAVVAGLPDVLWPRSLSLGVHRHAELRSDDRP